MTERIVVVRNPNSSNADRVNERVIHPLQKAYGKQVEVFKTPSKYWQNNFEAMQKFFQPGDNVIVAAGDGTANAAVNALPEDTRIGFLPYGNINDMAATFTSQRDRRFPARLLLGDNIKLHPLEVSINGEAYRQAALYATLGWTARVAELFDHPRRRRILRRSDNHLIATFWEAAKMYAKTHNESQLPPFWTDENTEPRTGMTDVVAVNGPIMAKIIRSGRDFYAGNDFLAKELDVSSLAKSVHFLGMSALNHSGVSLAFPDEHIVPSIDIHFKEPSSVPLQLDGEYSLKHEVEHIRIDKDTARHVTVMRSRDVI